MECPECRQDTMEETSIIEIDDRDYFGSAGHRTIDWGHEYTCEACGCIIQRPLGAGYWDYEVIQHGSEEVAG